MSFMVGPPPQVAGPFSPDVVLVSWWEMQEASGTTRLDSHASNDLADTNTVGRVAGHVDTYAADFIAANSETLGIAASIPALEGGKRSYSMHCWYKPTTNVTWAGLMNHGYGATAGQFDYGLFVNSGVVKFYVPYTPPSTYVFATIGSALTAGTWYMIAAWFDYPTLTLSVSINDGTVGTNVTGGNQLLHDGRFAIGEYIGNSFTDGAIGPASFHTGAYTADDVTYLYNGGNGRTYAELGY